MMETLVVVDQHRNRYLGEINCRTFQSGVGLLPTPFKACTTPVTKRPCSYLASPETPSPKTPSPSVNFHHIEKPKHLKKTAKSSSIPISYDGFHYSELWAGPAYSNSPPPSSLPIPKFSLRPKRTVSLNLPSAASDIYLHPIAKSAPPSPTRDRSNAFSRDIFHGADSATKTLRRILNLDIADE